VIASDVMTAIEIEGVSVTIDGRRLLSAVDLSVQTGEVVGVIGASGSGKTTLLRLMAGLTAPTQGVVRFGGVPAVPTGFVTMALQDDPMYTNRDVAGNLGFPLDMARTHRPEDRAERIERTARRMGVRRILSRRSDQISGGERAAVSVGRAIIGDRARFVLLDEPLSKADLRRRQALRNMVRSFRQERPDIGIVIASNDQNDLFGLVDRLVVLVDGAIVQIGPPAELYDRPSDTRVAGFLGSPPMNLFPSVVDRWHGRTAAAIGTDHIDLDRSWPDENVPCGLVGRPIVVGVRPEHLVEAAPGTPFGRVLHATVGWVEEPARVVWFGLGGVAAIAYAMASRAGHRWSAGDRLELTWAPDRTRIFDAESGRAIPKSIVGSAD
jgi:multiple sugar transport system ATP-binding protein